MATAVSFTSLSTSKHVGFRQQRTAATSTCLNESKRNFNNDERQLQQSRSIFLSNVVSSICIASASAIALSPVAAHAAGDTAEPKVKGTKKDPEFEACLGKCMYECTKPKGTEQKSRAECLPECKKSCATTKEQLLLGQPVKR